MPVGGAKETTQATAGVVHSQEGVTSVNDDAGGLTDGAP